MGMTPVLTSEKIRSIALFHRLQLVAVLVLFGLGLFMGSAAPNQTAAVDAAPLFKTVMLAAVFGVWCISAALSWHVFDRIGFAVAVVGACIPFVNFIVWVVVHVKATRILQAAGVKVGLLGAKSSTLPR